MDAQKKQTAEMWVKMWDGSCSEQKQRPQDDQASFGGLRNCLIAVVVEALDIALSRNGAEILSQLYRRG